jgi:hypothetical protein
LNVDSADQLAALRICPTGTPRFAALDAADPLVEWAEKDLSMPAKDKQFFIHLPMDEAPTAL